jgi:hypothetical protein
MAYRIGDLWLECFFKFQVDPDMNNGGCANRYLRNLFLKYLLVVALTAVVWWYWHPLQKFLNDLPNLIQRRP